ncbi:MAG: hypothetical protein IH845_03790 [Nanoarchaeota archaeon]|nr:hypothetical protein [Nanoarchaeota archaeon]
MRLKFKYSKVYFDCLNQHKKINRTWEDVVRLGGMFEQKYSEETNKIIDLIPNILNQEWSEEIIEVYIVDWIGPSFSHPLTLKVREDTLLMLTILTHELIHHLKLNKPKGIEREKEINDYTQMIFDKLEINIEKQIKTMREFSREKTP